MNGRGEATGPPGPSAAELSARYDSDSGDEVSASAAQPAATSNRTEVHQPVNSEAKELDGTSPPSVLQEAAGLEAAADDDDFSDDEDEEEELMQAMDWADLHDDDGYRNHTQSTSGVGWSSFRPNAHGGAVAQGKSLQPRGHNLQRLEGRVNVGQMRGMADDELGALSGALNMASNVATAFKVTSHKQGNTVSRSKDKSDRASVEQALDPRTRMVLFKMLNRGMFCAINGCISTGKEANVYHAVNSAGVNFAIKVYKTSILVFKDRDRYVTGDYRFRNGYCKSNPRKMVKVWAEKELRNLARLQAAGIRCPKPLTLQMHVLVMEFIGSGEVAAPRLKDADAPLPQMRSFYLDMVVILRTLFQVCKLAHGDLSEYNILVHEGELYIIDVSQSVDLDHPRALDFLREDIQHINAFFRRAGVATLTMKELFDFVVDANVTADNIDVALLKLMNLAASRPMTRTAEEEVEESIFQQAYIPRNLEEVDDYERDHQRLEDGGAAAQGIYYEAMNGMLAGSAAQSRKPAAAAAAAELQPALAAAEPSLSPGQQIVAEEAAGDAASGREPEDAGAEPHRDLPRTENGASSSTEDDDSDGSCSESGSGDSEYEDRPKGGGKITQEERKAHKKAVKEAARERRKTKVPKHAKKRAVKKGKK